MASISSIFLNRPTLTSLIIPSESIKIVSGMLQIWNSFLVCPTESNRMGNVKGPASSLNLSSSVFIRPGA